MKAAALDVLTKRNIFNDRVDAIRRFFEAQCTILKDYHPEILTCIKNISPKRLQENIAEICADPLTQYFYQKEYSYQGILQNVLSSLADSVDSNFIAKIAALFMTNPHDYRSGWPDLTVIDKNGVSFIEVKTVDSLHASQLRFANDIAKPLGLECCVVQLHPKKH